jgi:hypothetical protein
MTDGKARGLPKRPVVAASGGDCDLVDPGVTVVSAYAGTSGSMSTTGIEAGDLCIMTSCTRNATISTSPGGGGEAWTTVDRRDTGTNEWHGIWVKIAGASEAATGNFPRPRRSASLQPSSRAAA